MAKKEHPIIVLFNHLLEEAPLDFLGTGGDSKWAAKEEKEWYSIANEIKDDIKALIKENKALLSTKKKMIKDIKDGCVKLEELKQMLEELKQILEINLGV